MNDPAIAKATRNKKMRDQWFISNNKTNRDLKTRLNKSKKVEKKQQTKLDKNWQRALK